MKENKTLLYILFFLSLIFCVSSFVLYQKYSDVKKKNNELEKRECNTNTETTELVQYKYGYLLDKINIKEGISYPYDMNYLFEKDELNSKDIDVTKKIESTLYSNYYNKFLIPDSISKEELLKMINNIYSDDTKTVVGTEWNTRTYRYINNSDILKKNDQLLGSGSSSNSYVIKLIDSKIENKNIVFTIGFAYKMESQFDTGELKVKYFSKITDDFNSNENLIYSSNDFNVDNNISKLSKYEITFVLKNGEYTFDNIKRIK